MHHTRVHQLNDFFICFQNKPFKWDRFSHYMVLTFPIFHNRQMRFLKIAKLTVKVHANCELSVFLKFNSIKAYIWKLSGKQLVNEKLCRLFFENIHRNKSLTNYHHATSLFLGRFEGAKWFCIYDVISSI